MGSAELRDVRETVEEDTIPALAANAAWDGSLFDATSDEVNKTEDRPIILVADDNADMRGYLGRILQTKYRVLLARYGIEALQKAADHIPELILTDVMMPHMSGYDLLTAVKKDKTLQDIPIVFLTARAGTEAHVETLELGADDYIAKPFNEQEVLARISNLIRGRRQEKELLALQRKQLAQFLPARLGELLLSGNADEFLRGHRRQITVVFVDLRGFTAFAEIADPEDVMAVLQEYQTNMGRIISQHQGTIQQFAGDSIEIFLNDPIPVENHPEEAVRMAIRMREEGAKLRDRWSKRGFSLGSGIGIATGYATLGIIGGEGRKDYSGIGTVVNLAARLCSAARDGQILIAERLLAAVNNVICTEEVGLIQLKGFHQPVLVYNVTGSKS